MRQKHGGLVGDVDFNGVLNLALDLRGQSLFLDMLDQTGSGVAQCSAPIASVMEQFTDTMSQRTGTTSISVNRTVRCIPEPVYLHSECSLVMVSVADLRAVPDAVRRRVEPDRGGPSASTIAVRIRTATPPRSPGCRTWIFWMWAGAATWPRCGVALPEHVPEYPLQSRRDRQAHARPNSPNRPPAGP